MKNYETPRVKLIPVQMDENIASSGAEDVRVIIYRNGQLILDESDGNCDNESLIGKIREWLGLGN